MIQQVKVFGFQIWYSVKREIVFIVGFLVLFLYVYCDICLFSYVKNK